MEALVEQVDLRGWMGPAHPVELGREGRWWKAGGESRPLVGSDARGGQGVMALSPPALCAEGGIPAGAGFTRPTVET